MNFNEIPIGDEQLPPPRSKHVTVTFKDKAEADHMIMCVNAHDALVAALKEMLSAWEEQFGEGACDCQPEPQNAGHVCQCCAARAALNNTATSN